MGYGCANELSQTDRGLPRIDPRQPVEAHFHTLSDFLREIYDNSLVHPELAPPRGLSPAAKGTHRPAGGMRPGGPGAVMRLGEYDCGSRGVAT